MRKNEIKSIIYKHPKIILPYKNNYIIVNDNEINLLFNKYKNIKYIKLALFFPTNFLKKKWILDISSFNNFLINLDKIKVWKNNIILKSYLRNLYWYNYINFDWYIYKDLNNSLINTLNWYEWLNLNYLNENRRIYNLFIFNNWFINSWNNQTISWNEVSSMSIKDRNKILIFKKYNFFTNDERIVTPNMLLFFPIIENWNFFMKIFYAITAFFYIIIFLKISWLFNFVRDI